METPIPKRLGTRDVRAANSMILLACLDGGDLMGEGAPTGTTAYLVPCDDAQVLMATIQALRKGFAPPMGTVARTVRLQMDGDHPLQRCAVLTPREKEVVRALVEGLSYKMIAEHLGIGFETVRSHVKSIHSKLEVHNSTEAVAKTLKAGLI